MKNLLLQILGVLLMPFYVHGQGTINFSSIASSVDAPVTNTAGKRIIGPAPYVADLFWSSDTNAPSDSLAPAGFNQPFSTTTLNGGGVLPWWNKDGANWTAHPRPGPCLGLD